MIKSHEKIYIINLSYKIFYLISVCILSFICIFTNKIISQHKKEYIENYNNFFDPNLLNIENNELNELGSIDYDNDVDYNIGSSSNSNNKDINNQENEKAKKQKGERFYHIKRKQNKCLFLINLICSIIELAFTFIRFFVLDKEFLNHKYKIIAITFRSEIIFYVYILICIINISVIFFCFYFYIRRQYSADTKVFKKHPSKQIIDDDFIEEQKMQEDDNDMNENIITKKELNRKKSSLDFSDIVITKHFDNK